MSYKDKKRIPNPKEEQLVFEGAIPAIIDQETFDLAQKLRKTCRRPSKFGEPPYRLTGILICADCGNKLRHNRSMDYRRNTLRNDYQCSKYKERTSDCSMHYIRTIIVEELILEAIKNISEYVKANKDEFIAEVMKMSETQALMAIDENKKQSAKLIKRKNELDNLIKRLYESYASDKIPEKHFQKLLAEYDEEQTEIEPKIADLQKKIDIYIGENAKTDKFVELVEKYTDFTELTTPMLNEFVEKVIVHEKESGVGKNRKQKVEIYLNYIGNFSIPQTT